MPLTDTYLILQKPDYRAPSTRVQNKRPLEPTPFARACVSFALPQVSTVDPFNPTVTFLLPAPFRPLNPQQLASVRRAAHAQLTPIDTTNHPIVICAYVYMCVCVCEGGPNPPRPPLVGPGGAYTASG